MSTVLVTGANRGLGLEFARQYVRDGFEVYATVRDPRNGDELGGLAEENPGLQVCNLDIRSRESVRKLAQTLTGKPLDIVILNSGIYPREGQKIGQIDYEGWREAFETNVLGTMRVAEALLDHVAASERRQIAVISTSMASLRAVEGGSVGQAGTSYQYRSSKTALNMAMSVLAKELAPRGISVVLFDPGWVKTDMGGERAVLAPAESIAGMRRVLAGNPMTLSGKFMGHDGSLRPW